MAEFRRLISYLYEYEGKVKGKNVGFVKLETRNGLCKLNVSVKKIYLGSGNLGVYLLSARREIFLGNLFLRNGSGEFRTVVQAADIEQSGETMDDCYGLTMHEKAGAWKVYTTIWEDSAAQAAEVAAAPVLEEVAPENHEGSSTGSRLSGREEKEKLTGYSAENIRLTGGKAGSGKQAGDNLEEGAARAESRAEGTEQAGQGEEGAVRAGYRMEGTVQTGQGEEGAVQAGYRMEGIEQAEQRTENTEQAKHRTEVTEQAERRAEGIEQVGYIAEGRKQAGDIAEGNPTGYIAEGNPAGYRTEGTEQAEQRTESAAQGKPETESENLAVEKGAEEESKGEERRTEETVKETANDTAEIHGEKKEVSAKERRNNSAQPFAMNRNLRSRMNTSSRMNTGSHNNTGSYNNTDNRNSNNNNSSYNNHSNHNNNHPSFPRRPQGQLFFNMRPQTAPSGTGTMPPSRGESPASAVPFPRAQAFAPAEASVMQPPSTQQFAPAGPGTVPFSSSPQSMPAVHRPGENQQSSIRQPEEKRQSFIRQPEENQQSFIRQNEEPLIIGDPEALAKLEEEEKTAPVPLWDFLSKTYPKIQAFECQYGCEILVIKPQDIGLLPREIWIYGNNSFLLHGYYNYRYLILARLENPHGTPRHLLGVPGHYYSNEKYMASMFGFPNFVLSKKQQEQDGRFGYWYTDIRLGDGNVASAVVRHVQKP